MGRASRFLVGLEEGEGYNAFQGSLIPASPPVGLRGVRAWRFCPEVPGWLEFGG